METPIEVLRVEQSVISKELSRFRACDPETRSLYCREWAQYIYKKHFVWNAKTQEEIVPESTLEQQRLAAGKYQINFIRDEQNPDQPVEDEPTFKKERSTLMSKKFEELIESWSAQPPQADEESLINQISSACELWMTLPSGYSGLPVLFEPVEFNPFPDSIPLVDDEKDPSQLLDPLIIERQALCLPSDCFHLLKNLTGDILLSHTTPTCHHTRPESKQPGDLDTDRIIFNDHVQVAVKTAMGELTLALEQAWQPLEQFLIQLREFESRRIKLMGKGCQELIDNYYKSQNYVSFVDVWTSEQPKFKNKKSTPEEIKKVDDLFINHMERLKSLVSDFLNEYVPNHLKEIHVLTTDLWKMIVPTIYEMGERMASHENHKGNKNTNAARIGESLKALDMESLKKMESTKEFDEAQLKIVELLNAKYKAYISEVDELVKLYQESARPTLSGRVEKLNNKDFKKKIKKLESGYYSIRQTFRYETCENIFPESLLCKFSLVCLEPLMQEGEVMEALTIEKEVKRFIESHKDLLQQRCSLIHDFEEGVQTGRRELAGVLGKLFLKEGMRIQGENLALKRQNSLLKSMGQATEETSKKKKNKKKSSATNSVTASPSVSTASSRAVEKKKVETAPATPKKTTPPKIEVRAEPKKAAAPKVEPVSKVEPKKATTPKVEPAAKIEPKKVASPKVEVAAKAEQKKVVSPKVEVVAKAEPKKVASPKVEVAAKAQPKKVEVAAKAEPKKVASPKSEKKETKVEAKKEVTQVESPSQDQQEEVVYDLATLRAKVLEEEESKKTAEQAPTGWAAIAKKAPDTWPSAAATSEASTLKDVGIESPSESANWSAVASSNTPKKPETKKQDEPRASGWGESPKTESTAVKGGWSEPKKTESTATKNGWGDKTEPTAARGGWSEPEKTQSSPVSGGWGESKKTHSSTASGGWNEPKKTESHTALGGWGEPVKTESNPALGGWGEPKKTEATTSNGWNEPVKKEPVTALGGWDEPKKTEATTSDGWNEPAKTEPITALGGWGEPVKNEAKTGGRWSELKKGDSKSSSGWNQPTMKKEENKWSNKKYDDSWGPKKQDNSWEAKKQVDASGWGEAKKEGPQGWNEKVKDEPKVDGWGEMKKTVERQAETAMPTAPPGMTIPPNSTVSPVKNPVMPPGLAANQMSTPVVETVQETPHLPFVTGLTGSTQFQEPLPADVHNMSADMLLMIVKNLYRENGTLIQSVYSLQQEMNMITNRYSEIMNLAREREAQTLALFESRKQTEMEEVRRYVLSLEAKVKQLEEQAKNGNSHLPSPTTAGFGNQDLFAGYREEMSSTTSSGHHHNHQKNNHYRKLWQKNNTIRCGNCGEVGHASGECKSFCRYCGSLEHLSEACPMN